MGSLRVPLFCGLRPAWRSDLLENREEALDLDGNRLRIELGPHEILTVEIAFEEA